MRHRQPCDRVKCAGSLGPTRSALVRVLSPLAGRSGVVGHRSPTRPAATRDHESVASPTRRRPVACASSSSKPSRPSVVSARKERARTPARSNQIGTRPPGRWGNARRSTAQPRSQSQWPTPLASWRRSRRWWHSGLGENPGRRASSRRLYSDCGRLCGPALKVCSDSSRGHRVIRRERPARLPWSPPAAE